MGVRKGRESGMALVELALLLVILAAIVGVGLYVVHQSSNSDNTLSGTGSTSVSKAPQGTSAGVEKQAEKDASTEAAVDNSADSSAQQTAASANGAASNLGGAYNEAGY